MADKRKKGVDKKGRIKSPKFDQKNKTVKIRKRKPSSLASNVKKSKDKKKEEQPRPIPDSLGTTLSFRGGGIVNYVKGGKVKKYQLGGEVNEPLTDTKGLNPQTIQLLQQAGTLAGTGIEAFDSTGRTGGTVGGSTAGGALKGAAKGAALGSVVPGIGTGVGAVVGGVAGGISGLLKGKKRKREQSEARDIAQQAAAQGAGIEDFKGFTQQQLDLTEAEQQGRFTLGQRLERTVGQLRSGGIVSKTKAKKILKDGSVKGNPLTDKQKRFFGAMADGSTRFRAGGKVESFRHDPTGQGSERDEKRAEGGTIPKKDMQKDGIVPTKDKEDASVMPKKEQDSGAFQNGGEIDGPGGPKTDSIDAKLKPGTFIVPAENAAIAKALRKKFLGGGAVKATLQQGGGVNVQVSDGEEMFTPNEVRILENNGVDLNMLAPNAEPGNRLQNGGEVKGLQDQLRLELAKSGNVRTAKAKELEKQLRSIANQQRNRDIKVEQNRIAAFKNQVQKQLDLTQDLDEAKKLKGQLDKLTDLEKQAAKLEPSDEPIGAFTLEGLLGDEIVDQDVTSLRQSFTDIQGPEQTTAPVQKEELDDGSGSKGGVSTNTVTNNLQTSNAINTQKNKQVADLQEIPPKQVGDISFFTSTGDVEMQAGLVDETTPLIDARDEQVEPSNQTAGVDEDTSVKTGGDRTIANMITGLGAAQTVGGIVGLLRQGKRPVDELSPELSSELNRLNVESGFGLSAAEKAAQEKNIRAGRINAVDAVKATTTSPARSFGLIRSILAEGNKARLNVEALNQKVKQGKVRQRTALAGIVDRRRRQLFTDKLNAFEQNQKANAGLLQAGLSNLLESQRLRFAQQQSEKRREEPEFNTDIPVNV